jgi:hypothetical protein
MNWTGLENKFLTDRQMFFILKISFAHFDITRTVILLLVKRSKTLLNGYTNGSHQEL